MTTETRQDVYTQTASYLRQQAEIYGDNLYLHEPEPVYHTTETEEISLSWQDLKDAVAGCTLCSLSQSRRHTVFGAGNEKANLMLVGEAPGNEEDLKGMPFVGDAGHLLDKILAAIDFKREEVFIANVLKCRPPGNRDPEPDEIKACFAYLKMQIRHVAPKVILALGRSAAQTLTGKAASIQALRSEMHQYEGIPFMVTYHPAALLRNPQWKRPVWEDMQKLRHFYDEHIGDKPKWQAPKKT